MSKVNPTRPLHVGVAVVLAALGSLAVAQQSSKKHDDHEKLEHAMEAMERSLKAVAKHLEDGAAGSSAKALERVDELQRATIDAKTALPGEVHELSGEEQAKEVVAYRTRMLDLLKLEIELEDALLKSDTAAAKAVLKRLADARKAGHEEYGVRDKDGNPR